LGLTDFQHQEISDHLNSSWIKPIERVAIDSAHFYLRRGLALEPVPIATVYKIRFLNQQKCNFKIHYLVPIWPSACQILGRASGREMQNSLC